MSGRSNQKQSRQREEARQPPPGAATSKWEWVSAGLGLLLVLGTVGYISYNAVTTEASPPVVTVEHTGTEPTSGGYVVKFRARNSGPSTASALAISGELIEGSTVVEKSEVVLDYLPSHGEQQGGLIFQTDPAGLELRLEAKGYLDP
jgi:uncharacterized protein (TIGR02588 family)